MLGRGGMASVYLARDLKHDREVAVKVLRPEIATVLGPDRFLREIQIAAKLAHPHILPLFDSAEAGGRLLYIMPYVDGESLRDRLDRDGPLPVAEAVDIAAQVASALDYAHQQGVVHRDIKPENILLQAGQAVVADFGIARAIDAAAAAGTQLTQTGFAVGTPRYMSPEQIAGEPVGAASDVYSLGCVLYEMLAGVPPFDGPTAQAVFGGHAAAAVPPLRARRPEVTRELESVVLAALEKQAGARFPTAGAMGGALTGRHPVGRPRRGVVRNLRWVALAAAALAAGWAVQRLGWLDGGRQVASVAVLYLDNLSRDSADQYLADGITEEMIARLGQVERLSLPSRGVVRRFRGEPISDPAAVGRSLGVAYLVSGSLQREGPTLRIRVELVDAPTGSMVWSGTYDQAEGSVLAIQDSIAQAVARSVIGRLAPAERAALSVGPTENREAYDHYLRGNFYLSRRTGEPDGRRALQEYQAALAIEPRFPAALGRLGLVYGIYASWPWPHPTLGTDSLVARGLAAADSAIALDSASADGWLARGFLLIPAPSSPDAWDGFRVAPNLMVAGASCRPSVPDCVPESVGALARAVELAPRNPEVWYQYGRSQLFTSGGVEAVERSLELEPDRAVSAWLLGVKHLRARRFADAERMLDSAIALGRRDLSVFSLRLEARLGLGDLTGAEADLAAFEAQVGTDSVAATYLGVMRVVTDVRRGDSVRARARLDSLVRRYPPERTDRLSMRLGLAAAMITVGEADAGIALLERAALPAAGWFRLDNPLWDPVREDPRFRRIVDGRGPAA